MDEPEKTAEEMQNELAEIITLSNELLKIAKESGLDVDQGPTEFDLDFTVIKNSRRIVWRVCCDFLDGGPAFQLCWHSTPAYDGETGNDGYALSINTTDLLGQKPPPYPDGVGRRPA